MQSRGGIGKRRWVIAEGYIPPAGPYRLTVPARRTRHVRFNNLQDPEPIPKDTDYASLIESDVPLVVQHTRLDSRQAELALMTTMAYPVE